MTLTAWVVAVVVVTALYVTWTAGRLDRLHARVDAAWAALDAQLVRRAAAARALAPSVTDPRVADRLASAATAALEGGPVGREAVENDLSGALRAALPLLDAARLPGALREELSTASARVGLARSFHNAAVADARLVRRRRLVRALHLAGHRVLPQHFDIDTEALEGAAGLRRDLPLVERQRPAPTA
ncbi:MAG: rane protein [Frankiales bacterium]|nr:rane protein [Frankiales bacterium]